MINLALKTIPNPIMVASIDDPPYDIIGNEIQL